MTSKVDLCSRKKRCATQPDDSIVTLWLFFCFNNRTYCLYCIVTIIVKLCLYNLSWTKHAQIQGLWYESVPVPSLILTEDWWTLLFAFLGLLNYFDTNNLPYNHLISLRTLPNTTDPIIGLTSEKIFKSLGKACLPTVIHSCNLYI